MLHVCYMTMIYTLGKGGREKPLTFYYPDVFDNTCDICDFGAHIFCPQTTQELPKKHNEAGSPEVNDLPTDALSQIDYGHIRHCERTNTVKITCTNEQRKGHFGKFE